MKEKNQPKAENERKISPKKGWKIAKNRKINFLK
jgi:hypothetical protein